jgi:hypothetical protein
MVTLLSPPLVVKDTNPAFAGYAPFAVDFQGFYGFL